ncbi:tumor necrosis factor receptor superfamily member 14-like isoform X1 [Trachinotus anak]|uniref:tumor necrosis factor receptor superfamily member 14-like isoform X1 n=1 Tax=Trachinotus anak TaxID=443729 RepID=UPI0039F171C5
MTSRRKPATALFLMTLLSTVLRGNTLTCHPAEYLVDGECCPRCPAGGRVKADCTEFRSTSCLPCLDGTYMNNPTGLKACFPCTNCDAGSGLKTKSSCTPILNTVCEPLEGFYCIDTKENDCLAAEKHSTCGPGQYISNKGTASSDTECSDCSEGTFSDGTFTSCRPHTQCESGNLQLIKPGTAATDAECGEKSSNVIIIVISVLVPFLVLIIASVVLFVMWRRRLPGKICVQSKKMLSWFNDEDTFSQIMMLMIKMFFIGFVFILVLKRNSSPSTESVIKREKTPGEESAQEMLPQTPETGETAESCSLSSSLTEDCLSVESEQLYKRFLL